MRSSTACAPQGRNVKTPRSWSFTSSLSFRRGRPRMAEIEGVRASQGGRGTWAVVHRSVSKPTPEPNLLNPKTCGRWMAKLPKPSSHPLPPAPFRLAEGGKTRTEPSLHAHRCLGAFFSAVGWLVVHSTCLECKALVRSCLLPRARGAAGRRAGSGYLRLCLTPRLARTLGPDSSSGLLRAAGWACSRPAPCPPGCCRLLGASRCRRRA
jgi:hypothetical protein